MNSEKPLRYLFGPGQATAIRDLLQSLFIAELIKPSKNIWFVFGWISDVELIDNQAREFTAIQPDWPSTWIRLSRVMEAMLVHGGNISLVLRDVSHNRTFLESIKSLKEQHAQQLKVVLETEVHNKGIVGDDFLLNGSMNLTYNGITINEENIALTNDPAQVEEWRLILENRWKDRLE